MKRQVYNLPPEPETFLIGSLCFQNTIVYLFLGNYGIIKVTNKKNIIDFMQDILFYKFVSVNLIFIGFDQ